MALLVNDIILPLSYKKEDAFEIAIRKSKVSKENIKKIYIRKKSVLTDFIFHCFYRKFFTFTY